jgi:branched-chain amino acid transport system permease protein
VQRFPNLLVVDVAAILDQVQTMMAQVVKAVEYVFLFSVGAGLGSLAGALITPLSSVDPNMGIPWLVNAFMLVMVSGSSMASLLVATLVFGAVQVLLSTYVSPILGGMAIAVLAAITLRIRPKGFAR